MGAMASKPAALEAQALSRRHPTHLGLRHRTALASVDLTVPTGSVLGLVGPNGSGKSTFLRLAAGVDRASGGSLRVLGGSPREPRIRRRIGYLPEDNPFPADLSARAAFDLLGALDGLPRRRIREEGTRLLEEVGLGDVGRRSPARSPPAPNSCSSTRLRPGSTRRDSRSWNAFWTGHEPVVRRLSSPAT